VLEPIMWNAFNESVTAQQIDVIQLHSSPP
jgi:hypothetical protein